MRKRRLDRRTPLVALLLFLALALLLGGAYQGAKDEASAATIFPPFPSITIQPLLIASDFSPADGDTEVALNKNVTVHFNRDLDESTLSGNFYLRKKGGIVDLLVPATISYRALLDVATLNPINDLAPNATYSVTITDDIESTGGLNLFNDQTWSFKTISSPQVLTKSPAAGAVNVPRDTTVRVTFDKDMDWGTVNGSSFYLQNASGGVVGATISTSVDKRTATLIPLAGLSAGQMYVATLTTTVMAENGLPLESTAVWNFTTAAGAPQVVTKVPAHGATDVPVDQVVSATFDKDMDPSTLTSATFYVKKSGGSPLPATVAYSAGTKTATLDPAADLEAGATYEVTLTGAVESEAGASLAGAPVVWTFTTAAATAPSFTDVPSGHPFYGAITDLASRGIIGGYGGGLFGPNDPVRRQQFAKMIVGALDLPVSEADFPHPDVPFTDLDAYDNPADLYPHEYVAVCARNAITLGKTLTTFDPYNFITRYQVISMVVRGADKVRPGVLVAPPAGFGAWRNDSNHGANAARAEYNGLLNGLNLSALNPYGNMSRGEVAQILHNLIVLFGL